MLEMFGERQKDLLRLLHRNKGGMTIDEIVKGLNVTRTAVKQHLSALEREGFVQKGSFKLTKGRPGRAFLLSATGVDLFPKQYSWFSGLLLKGIKAQRGSEGLEQHLREMAGSVSAAVNDRVRGAVGKARITEIAKIMNELAYEAEVVPQSGSETLPKISANNCVYHHLAQEFPEVCKFDVELLERLSEKLVKHEECIIRGGKACRFAFTEPLEKEIQR
jgi:predicted ArsR family transcriptional regulator